MCGIAGWFGESLVCDATSLIAALRHRGPDGEGMWLDPQGRAGLVHTRLAILDTSECGAQPMSSSDGRYRIVFNGEIYNYRELREELSNEQGAASRETEVGGRRSEVRGQRSDVGDQRTTHRTQETQLTRNASTEPEAEDQRPQVCEHRAPSTEHRAAVTNLPSPVSGLRLANRTQE